MLLLFYIIAYFNLYIVLFLLIMHEFLSNSYMNQFHVICNIQMFYVFRF